MAGETTNTPASATTAVQDDSGNVRDEERRVNYAAREHDGGKATSPERDALYQHPENAGESGSQGDVTGDEDRNPTTTHPGS